jgi:hypothetical protein
MTRRVPIARLNASASTSVFFTSVLYTSDPTIGQNGTLMPSSCDMARAKAVLPVPGAPTKSSARPENFRDFMRSTTTPHAYKTTGKEIDQYLKRLNDWKRREWRREWIKSTAYETYLPRIVLPDEPSSVRASQSLIAQSKPFDMGVRRNP